MHHAVVRQITVALENQTSSLAEIWRLLAAKSIHVDALSVIDNIAQGVVRLITNNPDGCRKVLSEAGRYLVEADVLTLELTDLPGRLVLVSDALAEARINIDYAYTSGGFGQGRSVLILKVSNLRQATEVLESLPEA